MIFIFKFHICTTLIDLERGKMDGNLSDEYETENREQDQTTVEDAKNTATVITSPLARAVNNLNITTTPRVTRQMLNDKSILPSKNGRTDKFAVSKNHYYLKLFYKSRKGTVHNVHPY